MPRLPILAAQDLGNHGLQVVGVATSLASKGNLADTLTPLYSYTLPANCLVHDDAFFDSAVVNYRGQAT